MKNHKLTNIISPLQVDKRLYNIPCPIIGLTGGIATGKSTVSDMLKAQGHHIICADSLVKDVYKLSSTIDYLKLNYPDVIVGESIDFKLLREKVFSNEEIKEDIERLIYAKMPAMFKKEFENFRNPDFIFYDVPLLFEKKLDKLVDYKMLVYCPREVQIKRLMQRDKISNDLANKILDKQIDIEIKKENSDYVIDNSKSKTDIKIPTHLWD